MKFLCSNLIDVYNNDMVVTDTADPEKHPYQCLNENHQGVVVGFHLIYWSCFSK